MNGAQALQLAVVGHANTGKTSLLRTLSRDANFGEVSDRAATTRQVQGVVLLAGDEPVIALYDTPGLEDAVALLERLQAQRDGYPDAVARIEAFLAGDHGQGHFEQEAKVLQQMLRSEAALYVIDAREPVLAKHRAELRLLADCGRPLLPILNFTASAEADGEAWRSQLARLGLHLSAEFDTVVYEAEAERRVFDKLCALLEARCAPLRRLQAAREEGRRALLAAATQTIAGLLIDCAGLRLRVNAGEDQAAAARQLAERVRGAEQRCVDALLDLFRFELGAWQAPALPLQGGRWRLDPTDPEVMRLLGVRTGSAAAAGAAAGLAVDAATGGLSLGGAGLLGAGLGALWGASGPIGRELSDRLRGHHQLAVEPATLAVLAARQLQLLRALLHRGHAAQAPLQVTDAAGGWPSRALRDRVLRARAHPEWSALNAAPSALPQAEIGALAGELRRCLAH